MSGGACDGRKYDVGYMMRGGREMDNHFEVMWDLLHSIPSLETEGASMLDEYYWLNKRTTPTSPCAAPPRTAVRTRTRTASSLSPTRARWRL